MKKQIYLCLGWTAVVLGIIGVFLPVFPTTPFLILAAFFFSRSSKRFHGWLMNHAWFGPPLRDWEHERAIRPAAKFGSVVLLSISFITMVFVMKVPRLIWISTGFILLMVALYILSRPNPSRLKKA